MSLSEKHRVRSGSHVSSSVSLKSDRSKGLGPVFSEKTSSNKSNDLFSDDVFTGVRAGQPVTHMRSTNSKPEPYKQFFTDKIE